MLSDRPYFSKNNNYVDTGINYSWGVLGCKITVNKIVATTGEIWFAF